MGFFEKGLGISWWYVKEWCKCCSPGYFVYYLADGYWKLNELNLLVIIFYLLFVLLNVSDQLHSGVIISNMDWLHYWITLH